MQSQKEKKKTKKCSNCIRYLVCQVVPYFSHRLSIGLVLNRRTLAAKALYSMKLTIFLLLKNRIDCYFQNINSMDSRKVFKSILLSSVKSMK